MSDDQADSMLAKNYTNYDEAFSRLMSDNNIKYFAIFYDNHANPRILARFSVSKD